MEIWEDAAKRHLADRCLLVSLLAGLTAKACRQGTDTASESECSKLISNNFTYDITISDNEIGSSSIGPEVFHHAYAQQLVATK